MTPTHFALVGHPIFQKRNGATRLHRIEARSVNPAYVSMISPDRFEGEIKVLDLNSGFRKKVGHPSEYQVPLTWVFVREESFRVLGSVDFIHKRFSSGWVSNLALPIEVYDEVLKSKIDPELERPHTPTEESD